MPSCLPRSWPAFPMLRRRDRAHAPDWRGLSPGVAGPGADDTFLAAERVAFAGRRIERVRDLRLHGVAVRAARVRHVDGERRTGALHGERGALALALLQRGDACGVLGGIIERLAVGAALADRDCAHSPALGDIA